MKTPKLSNHLLLIKVFVYILNIGHIVKKIFHVEQQKLKRFILVFSAFLCTDAKLCEISWELDHSFIVCSFLLFILETSFGNI